MPVVYKRVTEVAVGDVIVGGTIDNVKRTTVTEVLHPAALPNYVELRGVSNDGSRFDALYRVTGKVELFA